MPTEIEKIVLEFIDKIDDDRFSQIFKEEMTDTLFDKNICANFFFRVENFFTRIIKNSHRNDIISFFRNATIYNYIFENKLESLLNLIPLGTWVSILREQDILKQFSKSEFFSKRIIEVINSGRLNHEKMDILKRFIKDNINYIEPTKDNINALLTCNLYDLGKIKTFELPINSFLSVVSIKKKELGITDEDLLTYDIKLENVPEAKEERISNKTIRNRRMILGRSKRKTIQNKNEKTVQDYASLFDSRKVFYDALDDEKFLDNLCPDEDSLEPVLLLLASVDRKETLLNIYRRRKFPNDPSDALKTMFYNDNELISTSYAYEHLRRYYLSFPKEIKGIRDKFAQATDLTEKEELRKKYTKAQEDLLLYLEKNFDRIPSKYLIPLLSSLNHKCFETLFNNIDVSYEKLIMICSKIANIESNQPKKKFLFDKLKQLSKDQELSQSVIQKEKERLSFELLNSLYRGNPKDTWYSSILADNNELEINSHVLTKILGQEVLDKYDNQNLTERELTLKLFKEYIERVTSTLHIQESGYNQDFWKLFFGVLSRYVVMSKDLDDFTVLFDRNYSKQHYGTQYDDEQMIYVNIEVIKENFKSSYQIFTTLFHEVRHAEQARMIANKEYNYMALKWAKDLALSQEIKQYYTGFGDRNNYSICTGEVDARTRSFVETYRFLKLISKELADDYLAKQVEEYKKDCSMKRDKERYNPNTKEEKNLDILFDETFDNNRIKALFKDFPILEYEYDENGIKRSDEELIATLKGIKEEINNAKENGLSRQEINQLRQKTELYINMINDRFSIRSRKDLINNLSEDNDRRRLQEEYEQLLFSLEATTLNPSEIREDKIKRFNTFKPIMRLAYLLKEKSGQDRWAAEEYKEFIQKHNIKDEEVNRIQIYLDTAYPYSEISQILLNEKSIEIKNYREANEIYDMLFRLMRDIRTLDDIPGSFFAMYSHLEDTINMAKVFMMESEKEQDIKRVI